MFWREKYKLPVFCFVLVLAAIAGFLTALSVAPNNQTYAYTWLILIFFALSLAAPIAISLIRKKFDLFAPVVLWVVIYGFLYFIKPAVSILRNETFPYGIGLLNKALLIAILGLVCFYIGYYGNMGTKIAKTIPIIKKEISTKRLIIIAFVFITIGFFGLNNYIQTSGGWLTFWSKAHGYGGLAIKTTAYIYQLPELMVVGFLLVFSALMYRKFRRGMKFFTPKNIFILTIASIGGVGIYTVLWSSRTMYTWVLIFMVFLYFWAKGTKPKVRHALIMVFVLYLVVSVVPLTRSFLYLNNDMTFEKFSQRYFHKGIFLQQFSSSNSDEFRVYMAEVALVPDVVPYDYFNLYLRLLVHPIPRFIWPTKPVFQNSQWQNFISKADIGQGSSETMLGDFYAQLGIIAVIIGTVLSGIFWRVVYEYMNQNKNNFSAAVIYAILLPNIFTYLAQMPTIAILKWLPYILPSTIIALVLSRKR